MLGKENFLRKLKIQIQANNIQNGNKIKKKKPNLIIINLNNTQNLQHNKQKWQF